MSYWEFTPCSNLDKTTNGFETISSIYQPLRRRGWVPLLGAAAKIEDRGRQKYGYAEYRCGIAVIPERKVAVLTNSDIFVVTIYHVIINTVIQHP